MSKYNSTPIDSDRRTTSVRLTGLDRLESICRNFGFKDRSHFFQLCLDALVIAQQEGMRIDWPPRFAKHPADTKKERVIKAPQNNVEALLPEA